MALIELNRTDCYTKGLWRVEEGEAQLKELVGGNTFPGLERMTHPRRRLEWLSARTLIKEFGYDNLVKYHPSRRPFLAKSKAHLSISHSYPLVAVIVSPNFYVGIDVESHTRPFSHVANKYLSSKEKKWVDLNNNKILSLIWSAKEALYKLPGMEGLGGVDMNLHPIEEIKEAGTLEATIKLGGTAQHFSLNYNYIGNFNVVWVCFDPKSITL